MKDPKPVPQEDALELAETTMGVTFSLMEAGGEGASSTSDLLTSRGVLEPLLSRFDVVVTALFRRFHRPRTPSTALKKLVEPDVSAFEMASFVGANC